jgi:hypothetical protein
MSMQAIKLLFKYLPRAYHNGKDDPRAREKVHNAATIAGMAFANAFLVGGAGGRGGGGFPYCAAPLPATVYVVQGCSLLKQHVP